jgi:hypothetical protein
MKKNLLLILLILFSAITLEAKKERGTIVVKDQKIHAEMKIPYNLFSKTPNFKLIQRGVKYIDENGTKGRLSPGDAEWFEFESNGKVFKMVSLKNREGSNLFLGKRKNFFVLQLTSGNVNLYKMFYDEKEFMSDSFTTEKERYILEKDGVLKVPAMINFRRDMSAYFFLYPQLVERIVSRELKYSDIEMIVMEYNDWLSKQ